MMLPKDNLEIFLAEFKVLFPERKIIFLVRAGSHFFDMATETSDSDYKGIYLPTPKEVYEEKHISHFMRKTQKIKTGVKNTSADTDLELISLTKYLNQLKAGDFNSLELLYTPPDKILKISQEYQDLIDIRDSLVSNNISSFLGFIKREYRKYGINIYHYKEQSNFISFLNKYDENLRLKQIWGDLEEYGKTNLAISFSSTNVHSGGIRTLPTIKIGQRMFQNTITVKYLIAELSEILNSYGHRQKQMMVSSLENKGLYHALRLIYEATDIISYGKLKLPFDFIRHSILWGVKTGKAPQENVFKSIDTGIAMLQRREKETIPNHNSENLINKLAYNFIQKNKIEYLTSHANQFGPLLPDRT